MCGQSNFNDVMTKRSIALLTKKKKKKIMNEINHQHMYKNVQTEIHHSTSSKLKKKTFPSLKSSWQMLAIMYMHNISITCTCNNLEMFYTVNLGWSGFSLNN